MHVLHMEFAFGWVDSSSYTLIKSPASYQLTGLAETNKPINTHWIQQTHLTAHTHTHTDTQTWMDVHTHLFENSPSFEAQQLINQTHHSLPFPVSLNVVNKPAAPLSPRRRETFRQTNMIKTKLMTCKLLMMYSVVSGRSVLSVWG